VALRVYNGRYEIVQHLARGGMAEVFLARDLLLDRPVALKVLFPEFATDRSFVERFRREARSAANLNHPNIVSIYDWGQEEGTYFIVMEYVEGRSLRQVIREDGPLPSKQAAQIGADIAAALAFAHKNGVIHRDVKPGNVLIAPGGEVKVTDFGIARGGDAQEALTQTGAVMGTATYFSPEQAQGRPIDPRSDVYALAVVLYEMVVGRPPFYNENPVAVAYQHVRERPIPPRQRNPKVPAAFEAIVLKGLAKNPVNRYASADELRADLMRFLAGRPISATPGREDATTMLAPADATQAVPATTALATAENPKRRTGTYVILLVVLLALLAGGLFLLARELGLGTQAAAEVVPSVLGKTEADATSTLKVAGFKVKSTQQDSDQALGTVIDQNPKAEAHANKGSTVTIFVSRGPPQVAVPDEVGKSIDTATNDLEALGLVVVPRPQQSDQPQNQVLDQSPAGGTQVAKGSSVTLTVSAGTGQVAVPNVVGQNATDAANILGQAGFKTSQRTQSSDTVEAGKVVSTSPAAGTKAAKGSTVTMTVSSGPSATTTSESPTSTTQTTSTTATVPSVVGDSEGIARTKIQARGFNLSVSNCPTSSSIVTTQDPAGGTTAARGSTVSISCS
jgi:beta-lactam-binding protein with PASTA domain/predicted Ser/Thr protein kinase